ncbi:MAG: CNNM domain-containing protein, partial [Thermoguttaceae bacterium]|nr:CNNM domain-containing protein [Thermoguttaceae bacterium]
VIADTLSKFKKNIHQPIAAVLILNTTAHTIGASVAGASFSELFGSKWIWVFSITFTFVMLQYTEILPKTVGVRYRRRLGVMIARPLEWAVKIMSSFITMTYFFNRPFESKEKKGERLSTVDEIALMAALARQRHLIGVQQEQIIVGATKLSTEKTREVMIPMSEVVMLSTSMSLLQALEEAHIDAHTRFPVCRESDRNDIVGYVNFKEIVSHQRLNPRATEFSEIIRPVSFVDPGTPASILLRDFTAKHEHIAIVRDFGGVCIGMVSLEDVVEELVGEIEDEFDRLPRSMHALAKNTFLVGGGCPLKEVAQMIKDNYGVDLFSNLNDKSLYADKTLAFWLETQLGEIPRRGGQVTLGNVSFAIRRIRRRKIFDVQIQRVIQSSQGNCP